MSMGAYNVPNGEREAAIAFVLKLDIKKLANQIMQKLFNDLAMHFDFELNNNEFLEEK